ncbi:unnamed protein product [Mytilus edulis]|uniref:Uncharacterized protein n=1 Tax=Mytilus edulis TaxID=6550 RepID=A0A8S3SSZ5_MYTED|nr:unnamed protein product [Mytilus edulis]
MDYADDALCQGGDRNVENFTIPLQFESFVSKESFDDTNLVAESDFDIFQTAIFDLGLNFEEMQAPSDRFAKDVTDEEISNLGLSDLRLDNKDIKHYARGPRCIVDFYETYLKAIGSGVFYRKPLISDVQDKHRYGKSALGVNKLNGLMREMFFAIFRDIPCEVLHKSLILVRILEKNHTILFFQVKEVYNSQGNPVTKTTLGTEKNEGQKQTT